MESSSSRATRPTPSPATSSPSPTARSEPLAVRDFIVVGGGCYGTFYARQLARAKARGVLAYDRVLVVDRDPACQVAKELPPSPDRALVAQDWDQFFDSYFPAALSSSPAAPPSYVVPSPLMPHLMFNWLMRRARALWPGREVAQEPLSDPVGTPYDTLAPDGTRYVSWADWLCPTHCIEPATCPIIRAPRTWEMSETAAGVVERLSRTRNVAGPALFVTRHLTDGVGAFAVSDAVAAAGLLEGAGESGRPAALLVGTVSACHGALGLLGIA